MLLTISSPLGEDVRRRRPHHFGVQEPGAVRGAGHLGPAVVAAGHDQIQFVVDVGAELAGPQPARAVPGKALDVSVTQAVDRVLAEGVSRRRAAVRREAEDLAAEGLRVLWLLAALGVAGSHIQEAVGAETDPSAVMRAGLRDPGEDQLRRRRAPTARRAPSSRMRAILLSAAAVK